MDETDEEGYDDQTCDTTDHAEDHGKPHCDEHASALKKDCEDIDQHLCE